ncbi:MAG: ParB/RepB/Spo0J family partition protein [Acidobacteriota bacterium]|nr:ParB/RepB/Spo0J family partition protein [Acidobacteriota bacterium]MDQ7086782.1 ParB/RepB/Spo0J family partition protein [Acidobacteriota bacterium]
MSKGRGLPPSARMRADAHFVDHITAARPAAVGRMVEIDLIRPNPTQPRRELAGIEELAESVREKGILEPILVRPREDGTFEIIAGERRYHAARRVGLANVPCIEVDVDDRGCLEISLIENLQRRDLTPFEEAEAIARLVEDFSYTHEQIARKLGRSRTSITELLSLNRMPPAVQEACRRADIRTKSTLMEIVRQPTEEDMLSLVAAVASESLTRDEVRERKRRGGGGEGKSEGSRVRPYVFRYKPPGRDFSLSLRFEREVVEPRELLVTLEEIVKDLRRQVAEEDGRD